MVYYYVICLQADGEFDPFQTANTLSAFIKKLNAEVSQVFSFTNLIIKRVFPGKAG